MLAQALLLSSNSTASNITSANASNLLAKRGKKQAEFVPHIRARLATRSPPRAGNTLGKVSVLDKRRASSRPNKAKNLTENLTEAQRYLQSMRQAINAKNSIKTRSGSRADQSKKTHSYKRKPGSGSVERTAAPKCIQSNNGNMNKKKLVLKDSSNNKEYDESGLSMMTPSDNSSFSFTPTVVKPDLAERYRFEAELTTKLAQATKQIKESPRGTYMPPYSISDSGKSTTSQSSARGTPGGRADIARESPKRFINI